MAGQRQMKSIVIVQCLDKVNFKREFFNFILNHLFLKVVLNNCLNLYKDVEERMDQGKAF